MIHLQIALLLATVHTASLTIRNERNYPGSCRGDLWQRKKCYPAYQNLTGHCNLNSLQHSPVCMNERILYSHVVHENNYKLDIESGDYPILSRFPRCWNKLAPLICETSFRRCCIQTSYNRTGNRTIVKDLEVRNVIRRTQCLKIRAECAQLTDFNLWPTQIDCNDTRVFSDDCDAETVKEKEDAGYPACFADLRYSESINALYVVDACALRCRSQWLNEPVVVTYFSVIFFIYMLVAALLTQFIQEKLLKEPGVSKAFEIFYITLLWIKFNPFAVYYSYMIIEKSCENDVRMMPDFWFKLFDSFHTWISLLIVFMSLYYATKLMCFAMRTTIASYSSVLKDINEKGCAITVVWFGFVLWRYIVREEVTRLTTVQLDGFNSTCFFAHCSLLILAIVVMVVFLRSPNRAKFVTLRKGERLNSEVAQNFEPGHVHELENEPRKWQNVDMESFEPENLQESGYVKSGEAGESPHTVEDRDLFMMRQVGKLVFLQLLIVIVALVMHILLFVFRIDLPALEMKAYHDFLSVIAKKPKLVSDELPNSVWHTLSLVGYHFLINFLIYLPYVLLTVYLFNWELEAFSISGEEDEYTGNDEDDEEQETREVIRMIKDRKKTADSVATEVTAR